MLKNWIFVCQKMNSDPTHTTYKINTNKHSHNVKPKTIKPLERNSDKICITLSQAKISQQWHKNLIHKRKKIDKENLIKLNISLFGKTKKRERESRWIVKMADQ